MSATEQPRLPLPPFDIAGATLKVRLAEDAWNTREPERVSLAYSADSVWRNRSEFLQGRQAIVQFLTRKWNKELDYRLIKELWAFTADRIAVRFAYEWHDDSGNWFRSYGNENWEFDTNGLMRRPSGRPPGSLRPWTIVVRGGEGFSLSKNQGKKKSSLLPQFGLV